MKKYLVILALGIFVWTAPAFADPALFLGLSYNLGDTVGLSAKVLSDDEEHRLVGSLGATYFPFFKEQKWGIDLGLGYTFDNSAAILGWDFLSHKPQVSAGWADIEEDPKPAPSPPPAISDRRLKEDIIKIGQTHQGLPLYTFRYIGKDKTHIGVMAQDVLQVYPEAVLVGEDGYYMVDYGKLGLAYLLL